MPRSYVPRLHSSLAAPTKLHSPQSTPNLLPSSSEPILETSQASPPVVLPGGGALALAVRTRHQHQPSAPGVYKLDVGPVDHRKPPAPPTAAPAHRAAPFTRQTKQADEAVHPHRSLDRASTNAVLCHTQYLVWPRADDSALLAAGPAFSPGGRGAGGQGPASSQAAPTSAWLVRPPDHPT